MAYIAFTAFVEPPKYANQVAPAKTVAEAMELANADMGFNWPLTVAECTPKLALYANTGFAHEIVFFDGVAMTATEAKRVAA